mgnify:FL=1
MIATASNDGTVTLLDSTTGKKFYTGKTLDESNFFPVRK